MVDGTPALQAAFAAMQRRLTDVVAAALAERAGVDPEDPEPQLAATIVLGLWQTQFRAFQRYADARLPLDEARDAVRGDVHRAARVANSGLSSFNLALQGSGSAQQLRDAADAANEARKQMISALHQARETWRQLKTGLGTSEVADVRRDIMQERRRLKNELREEIRAARRDARQRGRGR